MRILRVIVAVAVLSFVAVQLGPVGAAGPVSEVLIGELLPLTGNFASLGQQYLWAGQTDEDIVNNDYPELQVPLGPGKGFPGLGGAKMTLVVRDDQSRGDQARTLAEQLITVNKVHWLNGEGTSGNTSIIQPLVESYGIPMSCHPCASPTLTEKGFKWFYRTGPNDGTMVASVFQFLKEWPSHGGPSDLKTIALFTCDNLFCQDNRKIALELSEKGGYKIVADLTTKTGATTLASEVQRLQAANPDILFAVQYPAETTVFQADMKRANYMPKILATSNGAYSDQTWLTAQKPTAGAAGWLGRDPTAIDLASKKASWKKVNETDMKPDQMIIDYKGIKFDKNRQNELATGVVTQIGWDDEKHTLWPWDLAAQAGFKPIYPSPSWQERETRSKK